MNYKNLLITGVAGLLGTHVSNYLLHKGYNVIGIDDLSGGYKENIHENVKFYQFNILDTIKLKEVFDVENIEAVYHFAAYAAEGLSPFIRNFNYTNNLIGSVNIINECINHNIKKLIFTSSMAVYGNNIPPFIETMIPTPSDPYGIAKFSVEQDIALANKQFGLDYTIVRPHNVIGVYQNIWDKYRNVIGIWIRQAINNEPITIFGDGLQKRAFSDIQYYEEPFEKLLYTGSKEIYNIGADKEYTLLEVAEIVKNIAEMFNFNVKIIHLESRDEVKYAWSNHEKAKHDLLLKDKTDISKTIFDMFHWALRQPFRSINKMSYEINKNMYSFWK